MSKNRGLQADGVTSRAVRPVPWIACAGLLLATGGVTAQEIPPEWSMSRAHRAESIPAAAPGTRRPVVGVARMRARGSPTVPDAGGRSGPFRIFGASLVVPGSGQWMLGSRRSYLYLGFEVLAWAAYLDRRSEAARLSDRYRDLAREVARTRSGSPGVDENFAYYEAMARFPASGAWDTDPERSGLQPESDRDTYNGSVWSRARQLYLSGEEPRPSSPGYERALAYYREHGYPPEMAWDWRGDPGAAERYRNLLDRSDHRFRTATLTLGAIVANHLLSAVDGYVSVRAGSETGPGTAAPAGMVPVHDVDRWILEIRLPTNR